MSQLLHAAQSTILLFLIHLDGVDRSDALVQS
jgi:hypothetical protein